MKKIAGVFIASAAFLLVASGFAFLGMGVGIYVGEMTMGSKEPMIEMLFGGLIGIVVGVTAGAFLAVFWYRKITKKISF